MSTLRVKSINDLITNSSSECFLLNYEYQQPTITDPRELQSWNECLNDLSILKTKDDFKNLKNQDFLADFITESEIFPESVRTSCPEGYSTEEWKEYVEKYWDYFKVFLGWTIIELEDHCDMSVKETVRLRHGNGTLWTESWH